MAIGTASAVTFAFACEVITIPPDPMAPVNACTSDAQCAMKFPGASVPPHCAAGSCVGTTTFEPILLVTVPENAPSPQDQRGYTFALSENYQSERSTMPVPAQCSIDGVECDFLPALTVVNDGTLEVSYSFGVSLWPPGLRPNQPDTTTTTTSLPISAVFHPLWRDPVSKQYLPATKLGVPLNDTVASISRGKAGPTISSSQELGFVFNALLPQVISPTDLSAAYTMEIVPADPLGVFPPYVSTLAQPLVLAPPVVSVDVDGNRIIPIYDALSPTVFPHSYTVTESPGAQSLAGWTLHIDDSDGRRVSGRITLPAGATKDITVYDARGTSQSGETLFIDPPPGVDAPRLVSVEVGGSIFKDLPYPALPLPVTVSGFVTRADDQTTHVAAKILFFANGDAQGPYVVEADGTTVAYTLLYQKEVVTTDAGQYVATLPPGVLRAYVVPDADDLALTVLDGRQIDPSEPVQSGKALFVNPRTHVKGRVVLPDGTPVYAADVVIDPSADDPFVTNDDPLAHPREVRGQTDADGRFDVLSDPGYVDISIRPHDGTQFPWVVLSHRQVPVNSPGDAGAAASLTLADVVVPLPTTFTQSAPWGLLTDAEGYVLPHALVRAYAFPASSSGLTRGARLIGATVTDEAGGFQLFVTPPE